MVWGSFKRFRRSFKPVLLYHSLSEDPAVRHLQVVQRDQFERQMRWLADHGYEGVTSSMLLDGDGKQAPRRVAITFDDGCSSALRLGLPVLRQFGFGATVFIVTDTPGSDLAEYAPYAENDRPLTWGEVRTLAEAGLEIGSHGKTHRALPEVTSMELGHELGESKRIIEQATGVAPTVFAYPFGLVGDDVKKAVADAGYQAAFTVSGSFESADRLCLPRVLITRNTTMLGFRLRIWGIQPFLKTRPFIRSVRPYIGRWPFIGF